MKKLILSLFLGSSFLFSVNQSYSQETKYKILDRYNIWFNEMKDIVKTVYNIDISQGSMPDFDGNKKFIGGITGKENGKYWNICYRNLKYEDLDEIEKIVFNSLKLNKNDFVTILGFNGAYMSFSDNLKKPIPGYFFQGMQTHHLTWTRDLNASNPFFGLNGCYIGNGVGSHYNINLGKFYKNLNTQTTHLCGQDPDNLSDFPVNSYTTIDKDHLLFAPIKALVNKIYGVDISTAKLPNLPPDNKNTDTIGGLENGNIREIRYRILKYDDLDEIEKTAFDKLNLNKNDFVSILGFHGTYYSDGKSLPKPGYFFQGGQSYPLTWDNKGSEHWLSGSDKAYYKPFFDAFGVKTNRGSWVTKH